VGILKSNREYWDGVMLLGVMMALGVGFFSWTALGILCGKVADKRIDAMAFYAVAYSCCAVAYIPFVKWSIATGSEPRLNELLGWIGSYGALEAIGMIIVTKSMERGSQAVTWTLAQMAMIIPFLFGVIWGNDRPAIMAWVGVVLMLACVISLGFGQVKTAQNSKTSRSAIWALSGFVILGIALALSMIPSYWLGWKDESNLRTFLSVASPGILLVSVCAVRRVKIRRDVALYGISAAIAILLGYVFLYKSMDMLSSCGLTAICYPLSVGSCIIGVNLYGFIVKKEVFAKGIIWGIIGILLIVVGNA
jgi:hypothetical protein